MGNQQTPSISVVSMHMRSKRNPAWPLFDRKRACEDLTRLWRLIIVTDAARKGRKNLPINSTTATIILATPSVSTIHLHWGMLPGPAAAFISNRCGVLRRTEIIQMQSTQMFTRDFVRIVLYLVGLATASQRSTAMQATVYTDTIPSVNTRYCEYITWQNTWPIQPCGIGIESCPIT